MDEFNKDEFNVDEFSEDLNPDTNINDVKEEDNKAFDFDLSILDKVKPPQVELEKKEEKPIDEIHPMSLDQHIDIEEEPKKDISEEELPSMDLDDNESPIEEELPSEDDFHSIELDKDIDSFANIEEEPPEYSENPFINNNPYEETIENTNPYVDYDNMDDVIGTSNIEEPSFNEPIEEVEPVEEEQQYEEPTPLINSDTSKNIDNDFKDIQKDQKKKESIENKENLKFIFLFLMFVVIAALVAFVHFSGDKGEPTVLPDVDVETDDKDKDKDDDKDEKPPVIEGDFDKKVESTLEEYYNDGDITGLNTLLSSSYSDTNRVEDIHSTTNDVINAWVSKLLSKDYSSYEIFTKEVNNTRSRIDGLYNVSYSNVGYLEEDTYNELSNKISKIEEDSNDYYVALELYNNKDYNNAYKSFEAIPSTSAFRDNSTKHMNDIITSILDLLKGDIKTISTNLDYISEDEQQVKYKQIKDIIEKYAVAYPYVKLTENEEYNNLLKKYNELIK